MPIRGVLPQAPALHFARGIGPQGQSPGRNSLHQCGSAENYRDLSTRPQSLRSLVVGRDDRHWRSGEPSILTPSRLEASSVTAALKCQYTVGITGTAFSALLK